MSKTWETKKRILNLLSRSAKTPGEISEELDLAPSTVSEHIEALERIGAIKQKHNPFIKKWKYYEANPDFDMQSISKLRQIGSMPQIAAALAILLGIVALLALGTQAFGALGSGNSVVFSLTDPPSVPNGTQALNISYSSLQVHYTGAGNASAWVSGSGNGNLNLMSLINSSQVIGTGSVPANSTINLMRFAITSAYIVINGTKYDVTVPSGNLTVPVTGKEKVTSNAGVLIDLSPVVTTIYTDNSTLFVLVPSVKAVFLGSVNATAHIGDRQALTENEQRQLNATAPTITMTSDSFKVVNNVTELSVTIENNANQTVTLRHVILTGMPGVFVSPLSANSSIGAEIDAPPSFQDSMGMGVGMEISDNAFGQNASASENSSIGMHVGMMEDTINGIHVLVNPNETAYTNRTQTSNSSIAFPMLSAGDNARLDTLVRVGADVRSFRILDFVVTTNGTLELPFVSAGCYCTGKICPMAEQASMACIAGGDWQEGGGYALQPGASVTLNFTGQIEYANGHIRVTPTQGSQWEMVVQGDDGAHAMTNVTVA